jgi:FixJ family two-component response regulator
MREGGEDFWEKSAPKEKLLAAVRRALDRDMREREKRLRRLRLRMRFDALGEQEREALGQVLLGESANKSEQATTTKDL